MGLAVHHAPSDPAEHVAQIAVARRDRLLRVYRHQLRFEDLEDCYSQATLELLARARRSPFASPEHIRNALEQKFLSRINDRRRALGGRSGIEAAIANAVSVDASDAGGHDLEDRSAAVERQVYVRSEIRRLREVIAELTVDQRLVLHSQVNLEMEAGEFCARYGWSTEKFRKVAQRARGKLRSLVDEYQAGDRCRRLEPDLNALAARAGTEDQMRRARSHIQNCSSCAKYLSRLDRASRDAAAVLPLPVGLAAAHTEALGWVGAALRRLVVIVRHSPPETPVAGPTGLVSGSAVGFSAMKAGLVAMCVAGAAGSYEVCQRVGIAIPLGLGASQAHVYHERRVMRERVVSLPAGVAYGHPARARRVLSDVAQIQLEFAPHRAHIATVPPAPASSLTTGSELPSQSSTTVAQEASEFGFER
jgi:DNA-directed RNA polymerase specialized sigma24 family protein